MKLIVVKTRGHFAADSVLWDRLDHRPKACMRIANFFVGNQESGENSSVPHTRRGRDAKLWDDGNLDLLRLRWHLLNGLGLLFRAGMFLTSACNKSTGD